MALAHSLPASINRLSCPTGMDRQVWKESKGVKGTHKVSIQKGSKGVRGTYLLESTGSNEHSHPGEHSRTDKSGLRKNPRIRVSEVRFHLLWTQSEDGGRQKQMDK